MCSEEKIDVDKAKRMFAQAERYDLDGLEWVGQFSFEQMAAAYNGIGPEWFPDSLRKAIDGLHSDLQCVAFIHDIRWEFSDGSYEFFTESNQEFHANGIKVAKAKYRWWNPERYVRMKQVDLFTRLCQAFGWIAYRNAYEKKGKAS